MIDFLTPVPKTVLAHREILPSGVLGKYISVHSSPGVLPDLDQVNFAILGVKENRGDINFIGEELCFDEIRKSFYSLYPGNWSHKIVDLGDIEKGATLNDTHFAMKAVLEQLLLKKIIPLLLCGSQDLAYSQYRSYDVLGNMVNITNIDSKFDLGDADQPMTNKSFVGKIIVNKPYGLFNYSNLGYQSYYNASEEIKLMEKLFFEYISLGEISENNMKAEPIMRNSNIVGFDMKSLSFSASFDQTQANPNVIDPRLACILTKYAGQSNKTNFLGLFELNNNIISNKLYSEIIWYFLDGINKRIIESDFNDSQTFNKYIVQTSGRDIIFFKSKVSEKWWMLINPANNPSISYLPCLESDYLDALNDNIPSRWLKATKRV
mgnify:CR=1 FL=1